MDLSGICSISPYVCLCMFMMATPVCMLMLIAPWVFLCFISIKSVCPPHCLNNTNCDIEVDGGCPKCMETYYGRQCQYRTFTAFRQVTSGPRYFTDQQPTLSYGFAAGVGSTIVTFIIIFIVAQIIARKHHFRFGCISESATNSCQYEDCTTTIDKTNIYSELKEIEQKPGDTHNNTSFK